MYREQIEKNKREAMDRYLLNAGIDSKGKIHMDE